MDVLFVAELFLSSAPGDYNEELSQALKAQSALSEQTDLSVPPFERTDQSDERLTPTKVRRLGSVSAIIV